MILSKVHLGVRWDYNPNGEIPKEGCEVSMEWGVSPEPRHTERENGHNNYFGVSILEEGVSCVCLWCSFYRLRFISLFFNKTQDFVPTEEVSANKTRNVHEFLPKISYWELLEPSFCNCELDFLITTLSEHSIEIEE